MTETHAPAVRAAASVSISHCEHGSIHIQLHDAAGAVFATACMTAAIAVDFSTDLVEEIEAAIRAQGGLN
ncbi:hypothetical protein [Phenylobacterium sp.]|uniref:hypothetical protein n=1 Tax=Phenylobacterium sp. TaxID=1871053 RepID=UPI003918F51D